MDKALRPDRFDCTPNTPTASKEFNHWIKTFENFVGVLPQENLDKLMVLTNFLSPTVYDLISECTSYQAATDILKNAYMKTTNEVFARHLLSIRKQQAGESVDEYLQVLKTLSKDCNFMAVSAEQHREQYIRDAFISGLQSNNIRQRLLENKTLDLKTMFDQSRTLDAAQKSMESYNPAMLHEPAVNALSSSSGSQTNKESELYLKKENDTKKCWNCGNASHAKMKCPARDSVCFNCGRKGHFSKVCRSTREPVQSASNKSTAAIHFPTIA